CNPRYANHVIFVVQQVLDTWLNAFLFQVGIYLIALLVVNNLNPEDTAQQLHEVVSVFLRTHLSEQLNSVGTFELADSNVAAVDGDWRTILFLTVSTEQCEA